MKSYLIESGRGRGDLNWRYFLYATTVDSNFAARYTVYSTQTTLNIIKIDQELTTLL